MHPDLSGGVISDDELAMLASATDPDQPLDGDAVPLRSVDTDGLLPDWYMPPARSTADGVVRRCVLGAFVLVLVAVNCVGLCVTYGFPEIAW